MADGIDFAGLVGGIGLGGNLIGRAIVRLDLDTSKYQTEMKAAQAETTATTNTMSSGLSKFGLTSGVVLAGAAVAVGAFAVASVKAFMDAQKVMAQTEAVLKSTGGQANVTAEQVTGLASRIRDLSGIDDEAVQSSENLLLTFRDVRNETGAGNDIFNQATQAIADMSTALNEGAIPSADQLKSSTIQLGKALNDPIQGMSALRRVGVSFTEAQVAQITAMQESGDLMGAQKIILGELSKEFGGAAEAAGETFAGQLAILGSHFGDIEEQLGKALIPLLENLLKAVDAFMPFLTGLITGFIQLGHYVGVAVDWLGRFYDAIGHGVPVTDEMNAIMKDAAVQFLDTGDAVAKAGDDIEGTGRKIEKFARMSKDDFKEWSTSTQDSLREAVISLGDLGDQSEVTRKTFNTSQRDMLQDAREFGHAMRELAAADWVNEGYKKFLIDEGPAAVVGFSELNEKQQERWSERFKRTSEAFDNSVGLSFKSLTNSVNALDNKVTKHTVEIHYKYVDFDPSKPGMQGATVGPTGGKKLP